MRSWEEELGGGASLTRPAYPHKLGDLVPFYGLDTDDYSYVNDFDLIIQDTIANRLEGNVERGRSLDDIRGLYQTFTMDVAIPLFYNEPPFPNNAVIGEEGKNGNQDNNENGEGQGGNVEGDHDIVMGDDSTQSSDE